MSDRKSDRSGAYDPRLPEDPATVPAGLALDTQIGMEAFRSAQSRSDRAFADTQPMDPGATRPVAAKALPADRTPGPEAPGDEPIDVATAMVVCRRNGRAAPRGPHWDALVSRLAALAGGAAPDLPRGEWLGRASPLEQRSRLRELLMAAHDQHRLPECLQWLAALPEEAWTHMGD